MTKIHITRGEKLEKSVIPKTKKSDLYLNEVPSATSNIKPSSVEPNSEFIPNQLRLIAKNHRAPKNTNKKIRSKVTIYNTSICGISDWMIDETFNSNSPNSNLMRSIGQNIISMCAGDFSAENLITQINLVFSLHQPQTLFHQTKKGYDYLIKRINSAFGTNFSSIRTASEITIDQIEELMQTRLKTADGSVIDDSRIIQFLFICNFTRQIADSLQAKLFNPAIYHGRFEGFEKNEMIRFYEELHRFSKELFSGLFDDIRTKFEITPEFFSKQILPQMEKIDSLTKVDDPQANNFNANLVQAIKDFSSDLRMKLNSSSKNQPQELLKILQEGENSSRDEVSVEVNITDITQLSPREIAEEKTQR